VKAIADPLGRGRQYLATFLSGLAGTHAAGFVLTRQEPAGKWTAATYALTIAAAIGPIGHRTHRTDRPGSMAPPAPIRPMSPMVPMPDALDGAEPLPPQGDRRESADEKAASSKSRLEI
jgi:hypothetical protein